MARHNELRYVVSDLASKAVTPTHVRDNPKIYTGRAMCGGKVKLKVSPLKYWGGLKGYLLIRYLWTQRTDSIHDMCVVNTDTTSYQSKKPYKCLETAEKEKNNKYLDACLKQHRHFNPFVASVEVLIGIEAEAAL